VFKYIVRHPARSGLTLLGVATAMFLFCAIRAMTSGVERATTATSEDNVLVVYRENRYCPLTSQLPQDYAREIADVPGVSAVIPMRIFVNNCRASLDVVTFRGVPPERFAEGLGQEIEMVAGSLSDWSHRSDAALLGERLASRRGLGVGDRVSIGGITVTVAGIITSPHPQDENVAYTHLDFVQRAAGNSVGIVTQFNVTVDDPAQMSEVASNIDARFQADQAPTSTSSEKAFTAQAARDLVEIAGFARWLGWGALVAVFALVANAIVLSSQERVRDHAVLQTLGYPSLLIAKLIVVEGVLIALMGGVAGLAAAVGVLAWGSFSFSVEGISVSIEAGVSTVLLGSVLCTLLGVSASLFPAWRAGRLEIASCFRAV
jgi:putative ABC transport system permease protein